MTVILPQSTVAKIGSLNRTWGKRHPTLYLLHGLTDDQSAWTRNTSIERYAETLGLAVVMPAVNRSFYTDMVSGPAYWTFISEELPALARSFFPLSERREDNFVAGLSMGGYGALKLALSHPGRYAAAASLSGAVNLASMAETDLFMPGELTSIFGDPAGLRRPEANLANLLKTKPKVPAPALYLCCGRQDFLHSDNQRFADHCRVEGWEITAELEDDGVHDWIYWDRKIQRVLDWLPLEVPMRLG